MMAPLARGKWIPSPLQLVQAPHAHAKSDNTQRVKVLADVIESILGVIYLEFGYHISMKVGNELHVMFHIYSNCKVQKMLSYQSIIAYCTVFNI